MPTAFVSAERSAKLKGATDPDADPKAVIKVQIVIYRSGENSHLWIMDPDELANLKDDPGLIGRVLSLSEPLTNQES